MIVRAVIEMCLFGQEKEKQFCLWKQVLQKSEIMFSTLAKLPLVFNKFSSILFPARFTTLLISPSADCVSRGSVCDVQEMLNGGQSNISEWKALNVHILYRSWLFGTSCTPVKPPLEVLDARPLSMQAKQLYSLSAVNSGIQAFNFYKKRFYLLLPSQFNRLVSGEIKIRQRCFLEGKYFLRGTRTTTIKTPIFTFFIFVLYTCVLNSLFLKKYNDSFLFLEC